MGEFFKDLAVGTAVENEVRRLLARKFDVDEILVLGSDKSAEYDLEVNGIKFEIKTDLQTMNTGNVAIEISKDTEFSSNVLSGTSVSKADYYIYEIDGEYYIMTLNTIKIMSTNLKYKTVKGGDRMATNLALVKFDVFKEYASPWFEVSEKTLKRYAGDKRLKLIKM